MEIHQHFAMASSEVYLCYIISRWRFDLQIAFKFLEICGVTRQLFYFPECTIGGLS